MADNDNKKKQDDNDPFNFFKFMNDKDKDENSKNNRPKIPGWMIVLIILSIVSFFNIYFLYRSDDTIDFSSFKQLIESGQITKVELGQNYFTGSGANTSISDSSSKPSLPFLTPRSNTGVYRTPAIWTEDFLKFLDSKNVTYKAQAKQNNFFFDFLLNSILPIALLLLVWRFIFKRMGGGLGGSIFSAGQSKVSAVEEGKVTTRFTDVAGVDEAKEELVEIVDFLKSPQKYTEIGGKIPKGVLLVGPPGTGKTLLARAVAGEAGVPFFRISGSDFVEMFVGVGASRVRDLFKQARDKSPCIVFIDELDAIGKSRVSNLGGNDEREQTLNQLLVEMDGFDNTTGLILLAATNRPDVLDPALLRPGRFDRQVVVDRPDVKGREAILKIHAKNVKLGTDVNLGSIALATSGFAGADLANIINEAALLAVRGGRKVVNMEDLDEAIEKAIVGLQKKSRVVREKERKTIAYHETGHALVAAFTEGSDPIHKISIIPRGTNALGYTLHRPEEDKFLRTTQDMFGEIEVLLGGRAAEFVALGEVSTGAGNDLQRASDIARQMITDYGMSERFENVVLSKRGAGYAAGDPQLIREYSEATQQYIDDELAKIMKERFHNVCSMLKSKRSVMDYIANRLLEKEIMEQAEFNEIVKADADLQEKATPKRKGKIIAPTDEAI